MPNLEIIPLESSNVYLIKNVLANYKFLFSWDKLGIERRGSLEYLFNEIKNIVKMPEGNGLLASIHKEIVGLITWEKLYWDSKNLGIDSGRITHLIVDENEAYSDEIKSKFLRKVFEKCNQHKISYLLCRSEAFNIPNINLLEKNGFQFLGGMADLFFDLRYKKIPIGKHTCQIRPYQRADLRALEKIAFSSFTHDRFHNDPSLSKKRCNKLHAMWIRNSCCGFADKVIIAEENGEPLGFITCKIDKYAKLYLNTSVGSIDLIAVSKDARGRKIGRSLVIESLKWLKDEADIVRVGTQFTNLIALNMYESIGFKIFASYVDLRKWLKYDN